MTKISRHLDNEPRSFAHPPTPPLTPQTGSHALSAFLVFPSAEPPVFLTLRAGSLKALLTPCAICFQAPKSRSWFQVKGPTQGWTL